MKTIFNVINSAFKQFQNFVLKIPVRANITETCNKSMKVKLLLKYSYGFDEKPRPSSMKF